MGAGLRGGSIGRSAAIFRGLVVIPLMVRNRSSNLPGAVRQAGQRQGPGLNQAGQHQEGKRETNPSGQLHRLNDSRP